MTLHINNPRDALRMELVLGSCEVIFLTRIYFHYLAFISNYKPGWPLIQTKFLKCQLLLKKKGLFEIGRDFLKKK